jgi:hypothetical protein
MPFEVIQVFREEYRKAEKYSAVSATRNRCSAEEVAGSQTRPSARWVNGL